MKQTLIILFLLSSPLLRAQHSDSGSVRFIGFNANPILSQVIPFNKIDPFNNDVAIIARSYKNGHGVRAAYGFGIGDRNSAINHMSLSIGYDRRRHIGRNFYFNKGFDLVLRVAERDFITPPTPTTFQEQTFFGLGVNWGIEYEINPIVSVSTESSLRFGADLDTGDGIFKLVPPLSFRVHFNITKKNTNFD